jgi:hypothetical protein
LSEALGFIMMDGVDIAQCELWRTTTVCDYLAQEGLGSMNFLLFGLWDYVGVCFLGGGVPHILFS